MATKKLYSMSCVMPQEELDSVKKAKGTLGESRAIDVRQ